MEQSLEKLIVTSLAYKFPIFHGTSRFFWGVAL
jgi:hypothetical protein